MKNTRHGAYCMQSKTQLSKPDFIAKEEHLILFGSVLKSVFAEMFFRRDNTQGFKSMIRTH